ncbi:MAG: hypothetical protein M1816_008203 [Peltula sp. TS41687]|nr:MAG: hypothetical protein M1816_008203 [Peltula sp. TS41687]
MGRKAQNHSVALRIQALALFEEGVPVERVKEITGMSRSAVFRLRQTAKNRGYDPNVSRELKEEYVQDAPRSGRPRKDAEKKQGDVPETTDPTASAPAAVLGVPGVPVAPVANMGTSAGAGIDVGVGIVIDPGLAGIGVGPTESAAAAAAAAVAVEDALKSAVAVMDTTNPIDTGTDSHVNGFLSTG